MICFCVDFKLKVGYALWDFMLWFNCVHLVGTLNILILILKVGHIWFHYFPPDGHSVKLQDERQEVKIPIPSNNFLAFKSLVK